jgi:hypothetical protein
MADETPDATEVARLARAYRTDFPRYCREVLQIQTKDARRVPFVLNRAQRRVWEMVEEDIAAERPVRFYILKARQLGFSTLIQACMYWLVSLRADHNVLVAAHEDGAAASLFLKSQGFYKFTPEHFRPMLRLNNRQELHFANPDPKAPPDQAGLESRIVVRTANNKNLGASMTVHGLHLSEFAKYEGVLQHVKLAMATVLQTVPFLPLTFVFLETTADGMGYGYDFWNADNGYRKVFISWVADDSYTVPAREVIIGLDDLQDVDDAQFGNEVQVHKHVLEELRLWYPEMGEEAIELEALCRMQWRRRMIAEQFSDDLELFRQEYPITAEEAFLTSGAAVFDQRKLRDRIAALQIKDEKGRVVGATHPHTGYRFDKSVSDFYQAKHGPLRIYDAPQPARYVIGADVAEGIQGADQSVAQVLRLPELVQVAVFQDSIEPDEFADVLFHLGRIHGWAALCVEANGPGLVTNTRLGKELSYPNLYRRETFDQDRKKFEKKWGWYTNRGNKPVMVTDLRGAVRDDLIIFRDIPTLVDMTHYVKHDASKAESKMGAAQGEHDDTVMALALALQMAIQSGAMPLRKGAAQPSAPSRQAPKYSFKWWDEQAVNQNAARGPLTADYYRRKYGTR